MNTISKAITIALVISIHFAHLVAVPLRPAQFTRFAKFAAFQHTARAFATPKIPPFWAEHFQEFIKTLHEQGETVASYIRKQCDQRRQNALHTLLLSEITTKELKLIPQCPSEEPGLVIDERIAKNYGEIAQLARQVYARSPLLGLSKQHVYVTLPTANSDSTNLYYSYPDNKYIIEWDNESYDRRWYDLDAQEAILERLLNGHIQCSHLRNFRILWSPKHYNPILQTNYFVFRIMEAMGADQLPLIDTGTPNSELAKKMLHYLECTGRFFPEKAYELRFDERIAQITQTINLFEVEEELNSFKD